MYSPFFKRSDRHLCHGVLGIDENAVHIKYDKLKHCSRSETRHRRGRSRSVLSGHVLSCARPLSSSLSPSMSVYRAPILSAYFICALRLRPTMSHSAQIPFFLRSETISIALSCAVAHGGDIKLRTFSSKSSAPLCSIASMRRLIPIANPTAGISGPPSSFTRPSYRPPPHIVLCAPMSSAMNSNTVRV